MARSKKRETRMILLVLILVPLLFATGYAIAAGGAGDKLLQWFTVGETTTPPNGKEPEEPREEEPVEEPATPSPDPEKTGGDPVIYVGQILIIPISGGSNSSGTLSAVIQKGTVSSSGKQIALTFDSGWLYEQTIPLLNVLDQYGVKATFFPRAQWLVDHPDLGRQIAQRGHTMGNHSLTHGDMTKMSAAAIRDELRRSTQIVEEICGARPYLFRPPYGAYNDQLRKILMEEGYPYTIMWTVDTLDWDAGNTRTVDGKPTLIDVNFIVNRTLSKAINNGIVLMHVGGADTVQALPQIIEGLRNQGYSFTTVDKMLPPPGSSGKVTYTVKSGDTLYSIARRYGVSVQQIIDANNL